MKTIFYKQKFPLSLLMLGIVATLVALLFVAHEKKIKKALQVRGTRQELVSSSHNQELQKFNLTRFDDQGKKFWNLEGDTAKIDMGQTVYLDQNVTLKFRDGTVVKTDHVEWSQDGGTLKTDAAVDVSHKTAKIHGIGALGRPNDSFIQLNRHIDMLINETTRLVCDGPMKIFYKENKMVFYRKVKVTDDKGILR